MRPAFQTVVVRQSATVLQLLASDAGLLLIGLSKVVQHNCAKKAAVRETASVPTAMHEGLGPTDLETTLYIYIY